MPVNKNAFDRYRFLEHCFRNKQRRYNIDSLVDYVSEKLGYNISLRQIREDISNMKITFNAPIGTLQKILKIKETTLGEFFSWYFVNNFRKYCLELYSALPESLPIYTMEEIDSLKIRIDFA